MRILQISHRHHIRGGSDAMYFATSDLLRDAGHEVIPFCMAHPDNLPTKWSMYFPRGVNQPRAGDLGRYIFNGEARRNLSRLLRDTGPVDVAHLHIYHGKQTPAILPILRKHGIPVVQSLHEYKLACPVYTMQRNGAPCEICVSRSPLNCISHRCKSGSLLHSAVMAGEFITSRMLGDVRLVDRFLCVSDFQRNIMKRAGLPDDKLFILHNFVKSQGDAKSQGHDDYLLYFGRIEELKGLPALIDAVSQTGHRLLIAGDGTWLDEMTARIKGKPNIEYLGFKSGARLSGLIARAKAVVVPSEWYENCPMSVLEAKALGKPVIGARIGGMPELIRHGQDGFLFKAGNANSLIAALQALDAADHGLMSEAARQNAEARFSTENYRAALIRHYCALRDQSREWQPQPA